MWNDVTFSIFVVDFSIEFSYEINFYNLIALYETSFLFFFLTIFDCHAKEK